MLSISKHSNVFCRNNVIQFSSINKKNTTLLAHINDICIKSCGCVYRFHYSCILLHAVQRMESLNICRYNCCHLFQEGFLQYFKPGCRELFPFSRKSITGCCVVFFNTSNSNVSLNMAFHSHWCWRIIAAHSWCSSSSQRCGDGAEVRTLLLFYSNQGKILLHGAGFVYRGHCQTIGTNLKKHHCLKYIVCWSSKSSLK